MVNLTKLSDEQVVEYVRSQDAEAYVEIMRRYQAKLLRYATFLINDEAQAADVVQEAFIKAYTNLNGFDVNKKFSSWIYRIVHNEAMNAVKKYGREVKLDDGFDIADETDLEQELSQKETQKMVKNCLIKLPVKYREPVGLYFLEEKQYQEISDVLRLPINTVGTRISRGKKLLRSICQQRKK